MLNGKLGDISAHCPGVWRQDGRVGKVGGILGMGLYITHFIVPPTPGPLAVISTFNEHGAAIDLGTEVRLLNNHLKISAAVTDLGFISWQPQTHINGEVDGNFYFNGFNLSTGEAETGAEIVTDNLVMPSNPTSYTTRLNFNINAGVEYNFLRNHFAVGLLSHTEFYNSTWLTELSGRSMLVREVQTANA